MKSHQNLNGNDLSIMKQIDRQYGEKVMKSEPKKEKPKHRENFNKMSVGDILAMSDDDSDDYDLMD